MMTQHGADLVTLSPPMKFPDLPINDILDAIGDQLAIDDQLVVEAPPGAGKTTIIPLAMLRQPWLAGRRIIMLQPRRLAARTAALRMATLLGEDVGDTVGYRVRLDTKVSDRTLIEVVTEGVLLRMLQDDPALDGVGLLIFDEFHERSLDADLALALTLYAREALGEEAALKLLIMSATLAEQDIAALLGASCVRSEGRMHPVSVQYLGAASPRERIAERAARAIEKAIASHADSSVLVFLPGQGEIAATAELLTLPGDVDVRTLLGNLSLEEQQRAIAASPAGRRKVVLATNIAETSLTIEGVDVVIDSGLERRPVFDPNNAMSRLQTVRISQASSEQRCGRAGRLRPGHCYRLWSEAQQQQLARHTPPAMLSADLAPLLLQLAAWGVFDPGELRWLTVPPAGAVAQASDLLTQLGALTASGSGRRLTAHGGAMARFGAHPRLAHMLLAGQREAAADTACALAAVLSDRDPLTRESTDLRLRLEYLRGESPCPGRYRGWLQRTRQLAAQFRQQLPDADADDQPQGIREEQLPGYLLACAYPDRVARRRHGGGYQLANGRHGHFADSDRLQKNKWLVIAEIGGLAGRRGDVIRSALPFDPALFDSALSTLPHTEKQIEWDKASGRFIAEQQRRCGALLLSRERLNSISAEERSAGLLQLLREGNMKQLAWKGAAETFLHRARLMQSVDPSWPDFSDAALLDELEQWLAPFLLTVESLAGLKKTDVLAALRSRLSWEQLQLLDRELPERLQVPSGARHRIDYSQRPPVIAVKLQEMFGCTTTPCIAGGRIALVVHLLSPAGRPLQVTADLASFWADGYTHVRKEMKGRYPKHPWPDDPLTAVASAKTKNRL